MPDGIAKLQVKSLKAAAVEELERLIISGKLSMGSAMPPERELAARLGVSRPVVHEAMVELASKGFVRVEPRRGAFVNDFYRHGTLAILETIVVHNGGEFPPEALADVLAFRKLIELEAARLAASRRGEGFLDALRNLVATEASAPKDDLDTICELDFEFHLIVAEASGSLVFPLLVNSFRPLYLSLGRRFYEAIESGRGAAAFGEVLDFHLRVADRIAEGAEEGAVLAMREMLEHGERALGARGRNG
jgi:GntR family transcriptional regulator, transcriptional repressor for pyruvate dehydrogenase complex